MNYLYTKNTTYQYRKHNVNPVFVNSYKKLSHLVHTQHKPVETYMKTIELRVK